MTAEGTLTFEGVRVDYGDRPVLADLDLQVEPGEIVVLVGANGSGKSTLVRTAVGLLVPARGTVRLGGVDLTRLNRRETARRVAYLPQHPSAPPEMTVAALVAQGRYPHLGAWARPAAADRAAVTAALEVTDTGRLAGRALGSLSGGERQRVWCAVVVAQQSPLLLLDEPTTFLDVVHQLELLELVHTLNRELGRTVVMVLHDLNLAVRHADRLVVLRHGKVIADAHPDRVLASRSLEEAFDVHVGVLRDPATGQPVVLPCLRPDAAGAEVTASQTGPHVIRSTEGRSSR